MTFLVLKRSYTTTWDVSFQSLSSKYGGEYTRKVRDDLCSSLLAFKNAMLFLLRSDLGFQLLEWKTADFVS